MVQYILKEAFMVMEILVYKTQAASTPSLSLYCMHVFMYLVYVPCLCTLFMYLEVPI